MNQIGKFSIAITSPGHSAFVFANDRERSVIKPITARQLPKVSGRSQTKQLTELTAALCKSAVFRFKLLEKLWKGYIQRNITLA